MNTASDLLTATKNKVLIQFSSPLSSAYAYKIDDTVYLYHVLANNVISISYNDYMFKIVPSLDTCDFTIISGDLYDFDTKEILQQIIAKYISEAFPI